jgi:hypothetical protein
MLDILKENDTAVVDHVVNSPCSPGFLIVLSQIIDLRKLFISAWISLI